MDNWEVKAQASSYFPLKLTDLKGNLNHQFGETDIHANVLLIRQVFVNMRRNFVIIGACGFY